MKKISFEDVIGFVGIVVLLAMAAWLVIESGNAENLPRWMAVAMRWVGLAGLIGISYCTGRVVESIVNEED